MGSLEPRYGRPSVLSRAKRHDYTGVSRDKSTLLSRHEYTEAVRIEYRALDTSCLVFGLHKRQKGGKQ